MLSFYLSMLNTPEESAKYTQIYMTYRDQMIRIASKILNGNHFDAEDAVHDAFLALVTHLDDLPDHDSEYTQKYVFKMAKNAALMIYRKRYGKREVVSLDDLFDYPDTIDIPSECADKELFLIFTRVLNDMPENYKDILSMYWLDGYKPAQIAALLGRPTQTVYKQIQRGNQMLQEHLKKETKGYDTAGNSMPQTGVASHGSQGNTGI